jgi:O-antigen ligase
MLPAIRASEGRVDSRKRNPLRVLKWATYLLIAFTVGRVLDIVPILSGLPLVKVLIAYIVLAIIANHGLLPKVITPDNPAIKWAIALAVWTVLSFTFSIWLRPSLNFIIVNLPVLSVIVWVICKLSGDWQSLRSLFVALFVSAMTLAVLGLFNYGGGRLDVQSSYDTNDLAYVLVGVVPIAVAFAMTATSKLRRLFLYGAVVIMVLAATLTGSRGGMVGLLAVVVFIVLEPGTLRPKSVKTRAAMARKPRMGTKTRIVLSLVACVLVGIAAWPQLPPETQERLTSLMSVSSDYNLSEKHGRMQIWKRGMAALADRPIGYGVNSFQMVDVRYGGTFLTAHNSLVLVVVELGPIGLVMYLAVLLHVWRGLTKIRRSLSQLDAPSQLQRQQSIFCRMSQVSLVGNLVAGQFLSTTYFYSHWANIALAMAIIVMFNSDKLRPTIERKRVFAP